jgi:hypothetical protein
MRRAVHYQAKDANLVDYQIYFRHDCNIGFRGPRVPEHLHRRYGAALGSAAVFGRFVQQPFPAQLTAVGHPTLNLGVSGARPQVFGVIGGLSTILQNAEFVIIEFMSGRGYALPFFQPATLASNLGRYIPPVSISPPPEPPTVFINQAWSQALRDYDRRQVESFVAASRDQYINGMKQLIDYVGGNLILLWFSQREPEYTVTLDNIDGVSGGFPHFIGREVVSEIVAYAQQVKQGAHRYVRVVSTAGLPMTLFNRFTGKPESVLSAGPQGSINNYYPSQQMHDEAAVKLLSALESLRPRAT